jgi:hypothetical protein
MGKSGRCVGLTTLPPLCDDCLEIRETCWNSQGLSNPVMGLLYLYFYFVVSILFYVFVLLGAYCVISAIFTENFAAK